jgi:KUP system potassium uptake protein
MLTKLLKKSGLKTDSLCYRAVTKSIDALTICGDNGTSLIYSQTIAVSFIIHQSGSLSKIQMLGITSLIIWTLLPVFTLYMCGLVYLTDLENKVEGGSPAFLLLIKQLQMRGVTISTGLTSIVLIMMALTIPDFWLTAAISFLAAFGGLKVAIEGLPQTVVIICACVTAWWFFSYLMPKGIGKINKLFGPITLGWFLLVAGFSLYSILLNPSSLQAFNIVFALRLLQSLSFGHLLSLFGVLILIITGWEAAQLDRKDYLLKGEGALAVLPIQIAFGLNTITTVLSVLAQCSFVLSLIDGSRTLSGIVSNNQVVTIAKELPNLFFGSMPSWAVLPMVIYAVVEVIIAATATTLGAQNLFAELNGLGYWYRMPRTFTNLENSHEFYIKPICESLKWGCIALILWAQSDENLASAYGTSVVAGMFVGSFLAWYLAPFVVEFSGLADRFKPIAKLGTRSFFGFFVLLFIPYLLGGLSKIFEGSWVTLTGAFVFFVFLNSYQWGEIQVNRELNKSRKTISELYREYEGKCSDRIGILLTKPGDQLDEGSDLVPAFLVQYARLHDVIPHQLVSLTLRIDPATPTISSGRFKLSEHNIDGHTVFHIDAVYGWADQINIYDPLWYASKKLTKQGIFLMRKQLILTSEVHLVSRKRTNIINKIRFLVYKLIRTNLSQPFHYWVGITSKANVVRVDISSKI